MVLESEVQSHVTFTFKFYNTHAQRWTNMPGVTKVSTTSLLILNSKTQTQ